MKTNPALCVKIHKNRWLYKKTSLFRYVPLSPGLGSPKLPRSLHSPFPLGNQIPLEGWHAQKT